MSFLDDTKKTLPSISPQLARALSQALSRLDETALWNVTHTADGLAVEAGLSPRGGPFAAQLAISWGDRLETIGEPTGNNVIASGIPSQHAEDRAMQPEAYALLRAALNRTEVKNADPIVWLLSSAQSCTTCHTKQEILARALIADGLLRKGRWVTLYGATYDETFSVAQFYDSQYADAMIFFETNGPQASGNLIQHMNLDWKTGKVPDKVRACLQNAIKPTAIVMRGESVYALGHDTREQNGPFATPEVMAIQNACLRQKQEGSDQPWAVDGVLYTTTPDVGPLLFAEAGWTRINTICSVSMPKNLANKMFDIRETPGLRNDAFLRSVAQGYNHPLSAICVVRDETFTNRAQTAWRDLLRRDGKILYNGAQPTPAIEAMRTLYTSVRFAAPDLRTLTGEARPIKQLRINPAL